MKYTIQVTTKVWRMLTVAAAGWQLLISDTIQFTGVGESMKAFIADSCRATTMAVLREPEVEFGGYAIGFNTKVLDEATGDMISDTGVSAVMNLSQDGMNRFLAHAITELRATHEVLMAEQHDLPSPIKPRPLWRGIFDLLFGRIPLDGSM